MHEAGHILAGPEGNEEAATRAAEEFFGERIEYVDSPYGEQLEKIMPRRNRHHIEETGEELPYDEWLPAHAIRFNSDGTISLMGAETNPGHQHIAGGTAKMQRAYEDILASEQYYHRFPTLAKRKQVAAATVRKMHAEGKLNPVDLPYDEWLPIHAVKFNDDGTTELLMEAARENPIANIADGFVDAAGRFHPIRWATDYNRHRLRKRQEGYYYDIHPSAQYYGRHKPEREVRGRIIAAAKGQKKVAPARKRRAAN